MVKYSREPENPSEACKARGSNLRTHFKHCREIGEAIKGRKLANAKQYLENVLAYKEGVPMRRFTGGCGRHAQGKQQKAPGNCVRWPQKATRHFLDLLRNAESNAETKGLDTENLVVTHVQVNRAAKMRRRTYRAHGRIGAYMASPAHIELFLVQKKDAVERAADDSAAAAAPKRLTRKAAARLRLKSGGGLEE